MAKITVKNQKSAKSVSFFCALLICKLVLLIAAAYEIHIKAGLLLPVKAVSNWLLMPAADVAQH
jgi:hypothetical protein